MSMSFRREQWLALIATIFAALLGGWAVAALPAFWVTVALGLAGFLMMIARPMFGLGLMLAVLYFPVFPTVPFGPLEFSASTLMVVGMTISALIKIRRSRVNPLARWQWGGLLALGAVFLLATLFSASPSASLRFFPNLVIYLLILFSIMNLVDTPKKLWDLARLSIVLGFVLSIWRTELGPLRGLLGLPSLGINGAVFTFHPAVALILVILTFPALGKQFSTIWKLFAVLALLSLILHAVLLETRSAWLAWSALAILVLLRANSRGRMVMAALALAMAAVVGIYFRETVSTNLSETRNTMGVMFEQEEAPVLSGDLVRIHAREAGWRMFKERPILGWGPNQFNTLKPIYITARTKEARNPGAFNAWLIYLAEMGLVTTVVAAAIFLLPLVIVWRAFRDGHNHPLVPLAFGFALGAVAVGIHLLFVDLFFSFAWAQAALALAAARLAQARENFPADSLA